MSAQEQQQQNQQEVVRLQALYERRTVRSPIEGVVTELHRRPGEYVSANQPQLATVVNLDQLRVRFYLYPEQIESLQLGQALQITSGNDKIASTVEFISPVTDPKTGLSRVDLLIDNQQRNPPLRSGTPCTWPQLAPTLPANGQQAQADSHPPASFTTSRYIPTQQAADR